MTHCLRLQHGELERWLPVEEQYRPSSGNSRWKRCYVTLWLAGASAKLTVYENKETFKQLCDNIVMQWVEEVNIHKQPAS